MAIVRVSPGIYRDTLSGKTVRALTGAEATKMLSKPKKVVKKPAVPVQQTGQTAQAVDPTPLDPTNVAGGTDTSTGQRTGLGATNNEQMPGAVKDVYRQGNELSETGMKMAREELGGWNQYGVLSDDTKGVEDAIYSRLTQNTDRDYAREKEQLEQTLYNRGIALNPNDPQYKAFMGELDERYANQRNNARLQATEFGINAGLQQHQTRTGDIANLSGLGTADKTLEADLAYKTLAEKTRATKAAEALAGKKISGGAAPEEDSPFLT